MSNLQTLEDPTKLTCSCSAAIDIIKKIKTAIAGNTSTAAMGIKNLIDYNVSMFKIITWVKGLITNDYSAMTLILGEALTDTIRNFQITPNPPIQ